MKTVDAITKTEFIFLHETSEIKYNESEWTDYLNLCKEFRNDKTYPSIKQLQNEGNALLEETIQKIEKLILE